MNPNLTMLMTFLAVGLAIMGIYSLLSDLYLRDRVLLRQRVDEEFRRHQREKVKKSSLFKNLPQLMAETAVMDQTNLSLRQRLELVVEQSGLNWTLEKFFLYMAGAGVMAGIAGLIQSGGQLLVGGFLAVLGASVPVALLLYKRKMRREKLLAQLPDALDLMSRIIRSGQTMMQGMQAIGDEFEQPIAAEFAFCFEQQNLGLPSEIALRDLAQRTGLLEVKILVVALLVQQQTGGNLSVLLENLANVIRERLRMLGKIKALTAEGRMQALVLLALPPLVFSAMLFFNRTYGQRLLDHPMLLVATIIIMGFGALWIRKIVQFDF